MKAATNDRIVQVTLTNSVLDVLHEFDLAPNQQVAAAAPASVSGGSDASESASTVTFARAGAGPVPTTSAVLASPSQGAGTAADDPIARPWHSRARVVARVVARPRMAARPKSRSHGGDDGKVLLRVSPRPSGRMPKRLEAACLLSRPWLDPVIAGCLVMEFGTLADAQVALGYYTNRGYLASIAR